MSLKKVIYFPFLTFLYHRMTSNFIFQRLGISIYLLKILFIYRERRREGEREGEKHQYVVPSHAPPTGNLACNQGLCPDWALN